MTDRIAVTLLGTGSPLPDPDRAGPATLVQAGGVNLLVDCGRGVLMRLAAAGLFPMGIDALLLTHLHSDHVTDLNDLITTRWAMSPAPAPLRIFGPAGTTRLVDRTLEMLADDIAWRLAHHRDLTEAPRCEVTEIEVGPVLDERGVVVTAEPTDHRPVQPTLGYRVEHDGVSAALAGDTIPCVGLDRLCTDADMYVQTTVRRALIEQIPSARLQDILDYHSDITQAAKTAERNRVRHLVMTHLVPGAAPGSEGDWIAEAAPMFGGEITVGHDLQRLVI